jgi:hypothetical protein
MTNNRTTLRITVLRRTSTPNERKWMRMRCVARLRAMERARFWGGSHLWGWTLPPSIVNGIKDLFYIAILLYLRAKHCINPRIFADQKWRDLSARRKHVQEINVRAANYQENSQDAANEEK